MTIKISDIKMSLDEKAIGLGDWALKVEDVAEAVKDLKKTIMLNGEIIAHNTLTKSKKEIKLVQDELSRVLWQIDKIFGEFE